jgi:translocator protein
MRPLNTFMPRFLKEPAVLLALLILCFATAALGAWFNTGPIDNWYPTLRKPAWTPPNWVFAPVWTTLYAMMAFAAWLVWLRVRWPTSQTALGLFAVQLVLNAAWSGLFFSLHSPGIAFVEIILLWCAIAVTLWRFGRISRVAAGLLAPYLLWVTFATALNGAIWWMNGGNSV